ncbi:crossover junction endonuclease MUS81-like isoform X4 [Gallus gallus]|uniref:crossover junction endonuclease MUS81-like isoform X4 n=1 Tax=Gallus gallus TaxID=9031 RepID=UPI001AE20662|nr:crossover junction endonuclease MUS81-like isoform X4 [Gallus gallus]
MAQPRRARRRPNAHVEAWLREWREEAGGGARARAVYDRALRSLCRYPLPLRSGRDAAVLRHFGPWLCQRIETRLRQHRVEQGLPPSPPAPTPQAPPPAVAPPTERYRPRPRSAPYILLVALLRSNDPLPEAELLRVAPPLCAHPITAPGGALSTLIRRDLVRRHGRPPRYSLTERGRLLAQRLAESAEAPPLPEHPAPSNPAHTAMPSDSPAPSGDHAPASPAPSEDSAPSEDRARSPSPGGDPEGRVELRPGRFEVVLCADVTEGSGPGRSRGALPPLQAVGQRVELRRLPVGDFLWVARETDPPPGRPPHELVLDVVVERKTAADLCQSLSDGRYREQKWRLRRCGLSLPVFLLEGLGGAQQLPLPTATLRQAAASTQVQDGFFVKHTRDPRETAAYLGLLGGHLQSIYGPQSVGAVFARQLLQLRGLGGAQARALLQRCGTPARLMEALQNCPDERSRHELLRDTKWGVLQRNLGPVLSRALAQLYGTKGPLH